MADEDEIDVMEESNLSKLFSKNDGIEYIGN